MPAVQPRILTWARETAGLSLDEAAHRLSLATARGRTGAERLASYEAGMEEPSRALLLKMANAYRRSLLVFYLADPPRTGDRGQDFRTLPGREQYNRNLDALTRDIKARQGVIRSMLEENDDAQAVAFISSTTIDTPVDTLCARITERLGFSLTDFRVAQTPDDAFVYLRHVIEQSGVFVMLLGNLGSHHSNIPVEFFRGFALADPIAPMIVINDLDAHVAWSFTALHELVHLWLGQTGVSGGVEAGNAIEQYCNDVAGELLLPTREMEGLRHSFPAEATLEQIAERISEFATARRVSRPMVAYKLLRAGVIGKSAWSELHGHFRVEWQKFKEQQAEKNKAAEGGPNYYVVRRHRIGPAILDV